MYTPLPLNLKPVTERISDLKTMLLQEKNRSTAPSLPADMKKEIVRHIAYLEKEIERMYDRLAKTGRDTAIVSDKLTRLKQRKKKWK